MRDPPVYVKKSDPMYEITDYLVPVGAVGSSPLQLCPIGGRYTAVADTAVS